MDCVVRGVKLMNQNQPHSGQPHAQVDFATRPPSVSWEAVPFIDAPQVGFWIWFKPANVPQGLMLWIPDETYRTYPYPDQLSLRKLLHSAGVDPITVSSWFIYGGTYEGNGGTNPLFDQAISAPGAGVDPNFVVYLNPTFTSAPQQAAATVDLGGEYLAGMFDSMTSDWSAILLFEKQLELLRKRLAGMSSRLKSLNRDLNTEEGLHADRQDKDEWEIARRWLRDSSSRLSRELKAHDVGDTKAAGTREWFETIYLQFIVPRQQFDGIVQARKDFEGFRKQMQTLANNMTVALSYASLEGERRATQVLNQIAAKVRAARAKR